uniref:Uncharacterized protein n=1 Tax=Vibrio sp. 23023 TaxID=452803 RepID=A9M4Q0_9VIBR|nr:hypothetical protein [Vibrio sp. 23023]ABX76986.1 Conserved hypothetical protein [Vibrio sp. 23023]
MYTLHFKSLINLWDRPYYVQVYKPKHLKRKYRFDGKDIASCLFSIEAYATNPKFKTQQYSEAALTLFLTKLRNERHQIAQLHQSKLQEWGDIHLVPYQADKHVYSLNIDNETLCRSTGLLIKTFVAADNFLFDVYRAQHNEEISDDEVRDIKQSLIKQLQRLLVSIHSNSHKFHVERKRLEGTTT